MTQTRDLFMSSYWINLTLGKKSESTLPLELEGNMISHPTHNLFFILFFSTHTSDGDPIVIISGNEITIGFITKDTVYKMSFIT